MRRITFLVHVLIATTWLGLVTMCALRMAMNSGDATAAAKAMSQDRDAMRALRAEQQRLRDQLEWDASPAALREAIDAVNLPLVASDARNAGSRGAP